MFLGASAGTLALGSCGQTVRTTTSTLNKGVTATNSLNFHPVKVPIPLDIDSQVSTKGIEAYRTYDVIDDIVLPDGFTYDIIGAWGDKISESRFGYNNDYLSFVETAPDEGFLTINFEYVSGKTWMQTYSQVIGKTLPFEEVKASVAKDRGSINAFALEKSNPLKAKIEEISKECLIDQGMGIIFLRRNANGRWVRTNSQAERRITGISGLEDGRYLKATGPAVAIFKKKNKQGYEDGLGDRIIGTFANCAGGTTPWGTVMSAEENFQSQVSEPVFADGSALDPSHNPFFINKRAIAGQGNAFGLAGNKYGWMVEVDPTNSDDYGTKHTWLGRFRHEAVAVRAVASKPLAVYSGCDRRGGHLYKFVSSSTVSNPADKANSRLFARGMLYAAKFNPDGTGRWIPLNPDTPIDPVRPSQVEGKGGRGIVTLPNPNRAAGGIIKIDSDADALSFQQQYKTLGDLYRGNDLEKQGAILIDAHYAANAAGITCTARPEDTDVASDGTLYIAFTSGSPGSDGGPDKAIFKGPQGESPYEYGWIASLREDGGDPSSTTFRWEMFALGGEPADGCLGFSNPDNLEIDRHGNVWMVTDMSTSNHNQAVPSRMRDGQPVNQYQLLGLFGNNTTWCIPTSGAHAGEAYPFAIAPMETETCGPFFTRDGRTLFVAIQHPGEKNGICQNGAAETRKFAMKTGDGKEFIQERRVPIGSNWPGKGTNDPPKPAVVAIRRQDNQAFG